MSCKVSLCTWIKAGTYWWETTLSTPQLLQNGSFPLRVSARIRAGAEEALPVFTRQWQRLPPVPRGGWDVLQVHGWDAPCGATPSPEHRLGASCAQHANKPSLLHQGVQLSPMCSSSWKLPLCLRLRRGVNYTVLISKVDTTMPFLLELGELKAAMSHFEEN